MWSKDFFFTRTHFQWTWSSIIFKLTAHTVFFHSSAFPHPFDGSLVSKNHEFSLTSSSLPAGKMHSHVSIIVRIWSGAKKNYHARTFSHIAFCTFAHSFSGSHMYIYIDHCRWLRAATSNDDAQMARVNVVYSTPHAAHEETYRRRPRVVCGALPIMQLVLETAHRWGSTKCRSPNSVRRRRWTNCQRKRIAAPSVSGDVCWSVGLCCFGIIEDK